MKGDELVTLDDVRACARLLDGVIRATPVDRPAFLCEMAGRPVALKHEEVQRTGSFKVRGAYCRIAAIPRAERAAGVVAASAGNHAQGVALAATSLGVEATIFMPDTAPLPKLDATRAYGARVELVAGGLAAAMRAALDASRESGATLVSPFDDRAVIAGQGTIGVELAQQAPDAETVVVPVGGGGLVSGIAVAWKALRPGTRVVGVEAAGATAMQAALQAGRPVELAAVNTIADGIAVHEVGDVTLAHVDALVDDVVTVTDEEIARTMLLLLERRKTVVEPAGASALAAVLSGRIGGNPSSPVCAVLSGGNVDAALLVRLIEHGLSAAGRYLVVRVALSDRPGELQRLLSVIAQLGLNVVDVEHHRSGPVLPVQQVEVDLTLETRDPQHRDEILASLRKAGYRVEPR
ncbi:MAG TPA: threonine ammonia-lyase [Acidimicrobiia bacterium]|nr:threonine ammonia-lyase [Acidimicrobiia bacterium]